MTKKNEEAKIVKIKWRLGSLPTTEELTKLVLSGIISNEEAREILFTKEEVGERDSKSFESEIKFLRELVEKLSNNNSSKIIETIRYVEKPYYSWGWYQPYNYWCSGTVGNVTNSNTLNLCGGGLQSLGMTTGNAVNSASVCTGGSNYTLTTPSNIGSLLASASNTSKQSNGSFSNIKTF